MTERKLLIHELKNLKKVCINYKVFLFHQNRYFWVATFFGARSLMKLFRAQVSCTVCSQVIAFKYRLDEAQMRHFLLFQALCMLQTEKA